MGITEHFRVNGGALQIVVWQTSAMELLVTQKLHDPEKQRQRTSICLCKDWCGAFHPFIFTMPQTKLLDPPSCCAKEKNVSMNVGRSSHGAPA